MVYNCIYGDQVLRNALTGSFRLTPGSFHCVHVIRKECLEELEKTTSKLFIQKLGDFGGSINEGKRTSSGIGVNTAGVTRSDGPGVAGQEQVARPVLYELEAMGDVGVLS